MDDAVSVNSIRWLQSASTESRLAVGKLLAGAVREQIAGTSELCNEQRQIGYAMPRKLFEIKIIFHVDFYPFVGVLQFDPNEYRPVAVQNATEPVLVRWFSHFNAPKCNAQAISDFYQLVMNANLRRLPLCRLDPQPNCMARREMDFL